jgi:phage antirepressor YoqD-like protein
MLELISASSVSQTMTSKELYELICLARVEHGETQPRLNDFHARIVDELEGDHYETFVVQNLNKTQSTFFKLTHEQCTLVGMRESKAVRRSVLDKIKSLTQQQLKIPQTLPEALRLAADLAEQVEEQRQVIEQQKPAVEFVENYVESTGTMTFREVAKTLKIKEPDLRKFLKENKVMYRLNNAWVPYQNHVDAGRIAVKTGSADNGHAFTQSRFTPKGLNWLSQQLSSA